jgi:hypothetical protein
VRSRPAIENNDVLDVADRGSNCFHVLNTEANEKSL